MSNVLQSFNPMQRYRHLMNRWGTNTHTRLALQAEKMQVIKRADEDLKRINARLAELETQEGELLEEGKALVPELRGHERCYKTLIDLVTTV